MLPTIHAGLFFLSLLNGDHSQSFVLVPGSWPSPQLFMELSLGLIFRQSHKLESKSALWRTNLYPTPWQFCPDDRLYYNIHGSFQHSPFCFPVKCSSPQTQGIKCCQQRRAQRALGRVFQRICLLDWVLNWLQLGKIKPQKKTRYFMLSM